MRAFSEQPQPQDAVAPRPLLSPPRFGGYAAESRRGESFLGFRYLGLQQPRLKLVASPQANSFHRYAVLLLCVELALPKPDALFSRLRLHFFAIRIRRVTGGQNSIA